MKRDYLYIGALVILICAVIYQCDSNSKYRILADANNIAFTDSIEHFKNRLNIETASVKTLQLTNDQLHDIVISKDVEMQAMAKEFARVKSAVKFESEISFDTIVAKFEKPISLSSDSTCTFLREGNVIAPWYRFNYQVNNDSLTINKFQTWTDTRIVTGIKRKWFLGKETLTTDITNTNPNIHITGITGTEVIVPQPWYKKWYVWLAAGIAGGLLIK